MGIDRALLTFVRQQLLAEKPSDNPHCPHCGSLKVRQTEHSHTLIGGGDGTADGDPNHNWVHYHCRCGQPFVREYKDGNVWYTDARGSGRVLLGVPNCFERYVYTCRACGGDVNRRHTAMDGITPVGSLSSSWSDGAKRYVPKYRTFYACDLCDQEIEVDE